jgi:hypothetical protein
MRRLLTAFVAVLTLTGALTWASPAYAADSLGWDSGTKCYFTRNSHFSIVKVQWAYHPANGTYYYKPYAVHVLEADGAHHQTINSAAMNLLINGGYIGENDFWNGGTTYTFGPTRLSHMITYAPRGHVAMRTTLAGQSDSCQTYNQPS